MPEIVPRSVANYIRLGDAYYYCFKALYVETFTIYTTGIVCMLYMCRVTVTTMDNWWSVIVQLFTLTGKSISI